MDDPDDGPRAIFDALRDSSTARARLADEVERMFSEYPWLHGVDIDLESGGDERSEESEAIFAAVADRTHSMGREVGAALPPLTATGSAPASGGEDVVSGRFARITAQTRANIRSAPDSTVDNTVGTVPAGHLVRRDLSRDTTHFLGVGDRYNVGRSVAEPVDAPASSALVVGDWPARRLPVNGVNTYELNRSWQELLARIDIQQGNRTSMWQRWLRDRGYDPGPLDGKIGPLTVSALQRYLNANAPRPAGVAALVVDGVRGDLTRAMEKRFLNNQIQNLGSMWPQHYRHTT